MPDLFDDGEPAVEDFAMPGDDDLNPFNEDGTSRYETAAETPAAVEEAPVAADTAPEPQPDTQPDNDRADDDGMPPRNADGRLLAGKFQSADELERAYQDLQSKLGEQGNELGQYRQWYEAQQRAAQPAAQRVDTDTVQEQLYENPSAIIPTIQQAHQLAMQGDPNAALVRDTAVTVLREQNPVEGERFSRAIAQSEWEAQQNQRSYAEAQSHSAWNNTAEGLAQELPNLDAYASQMIQIARESPAALAALQTGSPDAKAFVLRTLYREVEAQQGRQNADTLATTAQQVARQTAQEAERAIAEASVASATSTVPQRQLTAREKDIAETLAVWDAEERRYADGWNIS